MATVTKYPSTYVGSGLLSSGQNIRADDSFYARVGFSTAYTSTASAGTYIMGHYFNFGFTSNAIISSVSAEVEGYTLTLSSKMQMRLDLRRGGTTVDILVDSVELTTTPQKWSGTSTTLWSAPDLLVTSTNFQVRMLLLADTTNPKLGAAINTVWDYISVTVGYTEPNSTDKTITCTAPLTGGVRRDMSRNVSAAQTISGQLSRLASLSKLISATPLWTASASRGISRSVLGNPTVGGAKEVTVSTTKTATPKGTGAVSRLISAFRTITTGNTVSNTNTRQTGRNLASNPTVTGNVARLASLSKAVFATVGLTGNKIVGAAKSISNSISVLGTILAEKSSGAIQYAKELIANALSTASVQRLASLTKALTTGTKADGTMTRIASLTKLLTTPISVTGLLGKTKVQIKEIIATVNAAMSQNRGVLKEIRGNLLLSANRNAIALRTYATSVLTGGNVNKAVPKSLTSGVNQAGILAKEIWKNLTGAISLLASITKNIYTGGTTYYKTLASTVSAWQKIVRTGPNVERYPKNGPLNMLRRLGSLFRPSKRRRFK